MKKTKEGRKGEEKEENEKKKRPTHLRILYDFNSFM